MIYIIFYRCISYVTYKNIPLFFSLDKMKIIDRNTGKRIDSNENDSMNSSDKKEPIKRFVEKNVEDGGLSPMDPPEAYDKAQTLNDITYKDMHKSLQLLIDEHDKGKEQIDAYEQALLNFKESGYHISKETNEAFGKFFHFFDNKIMAHNRKEEKYLFQLLDERLRLSGEHSTAQNPKTAIDLMEDDHVKFIQLATLTFNLLGLAVRLPDSRSRTLTCDVAYNNGIELVEMLKLHIFKEDNTLFPLAQKLITKEEFDEIETKLENFNG